MCDAIIIASVDTTFSLLRRRGLTDTTIARWMRHWEPLPDGKYDAQACDIDVEGIAIDFAPGDQLVFRYQGMNTMTAMAFIPNGDGAITNGRIPNITLPE